MKHKTYSDEDKKAAAKWWASLPAGKKTYLKVHQKLTNPDSITKYWIGCVKEFA